MATVQVRPEATDEHARRSHAPEQPVEPPERLTPELVLVYPELARSAAPPPPDTFEEWEVELDAATASAQLDEAPSRTAELEAEIEEQTLRLAAADVKLEESERRVAELVDANRQRRRESERLSAELRERDARLEELTSELAEQRVRLSATERKLTEREHDFAVLQHAAGEQRQVREQLSAQLTERDSRLAELASELAEHNGALAAAEAKLEARERELAVAHAEATEPVERLTAPAVDAATPLARRRLLYVAVAAVVLLATASASFALGRRAFGPAVAEPAPPRRDARDARVLTVPDVRGRQYAAARRMLGEGGFAWRVRGSVRGFRANLVAGQSPVSGTRVLDNGAPTVTLTLRAARGTRNRGRPLDSSPFTGTRPVLADRGRPAVAMRPPRNVRRATIAAGDELVRLSWKLPTGRDFARVVVVRSRGPSTPQTAVYRGRSTTFVDRKVENGVAYAYLVVSYDALGRRSPGVLLAARPERPNDRERTGRSRIDGERAGAGQTRTRRAPAVPVFPRDARPARRLSWPRVPNASYYNLQLYRGRTKVLDFWPPKPPFALPARWIYAGRRQSLTPGRYYWFVWPGFGARSEVRYGRLVRRGSFTVGQAAGR